MGMNKRVKKPKKIQRMKEGRKEGRKEGKKVRKKVNLILCISMRQAVIHMFITNKLQQNSIFNWCHLLVINICKEGK